MLTCMLLFLDSTGVALHHSQAKVIHVYVVLGFDVAPELILCPKQTISAPLPLSPHSFKTIEPSKHKVFTAGGCDIRAHIKTCMMTISEIYALSFGSDRLLLHTLISFF